MEPRKLLDKKLYEDEVQSQDSTDTAHSELIPYTESQSARESFAASSKAQSRRDTLASFGSSSNPPSGRKSTPPSDLASFAGESPDSPTHPTDLPSAPEEISLISPPLTPPPSLPARPPANPAIEKRIATPAVPHRPENSRENQPTSPARPPIARSSYLTSANLDLSPTSSVSSLQSDLIPQSKAHPRVQIDPKRSLVPAQRRPWSELTKVETEETTTHKKRKQNREGEDPASLFDDQEVYKVAHFIPKCSFTPAHLVEDTIQQQMVMNLPNLKIVIVRLVPGQRLDDFVNPDGDITGHILRSQKSKLHIKIHVNEHNFSQGDYFYVPRGNSLSLQNKSERLAVLLQLVVTKACD